MKNELEIGEILEVCNLRLQCREQQGHFCRGCYWLVNDSYCNDVYNSCGPCSSSLRMDNKSVIFVKVDEEPDA